MPNTYVKDGGVWKPLANVYVNQSGTNTPVRYIYVKDGGVWKQAWAASYSVNLLVVGGGGGAQGAGGAGYQSSGGGGGGGVIATTYTATLGVNATITVAGQSIATGGQSYVTVSGSNIALADGGGTGEGYNGPGGGPSGSSGSPGGGGARQGGPGTFAQPGGGPNYTWINGVTYGVGGQGEIGGGVPNGLGYGANGQFSGTTSNNTSGSGTVIISYVNATQRGTGGTVTSTGSGASRRWYHTFTSSGTYVP